MGQPTFFFPSNLPSSICRCDKPLEPLSTCPAYSNFLFIISFVKCNSVCNSVAFHKRYDKEEIGICGTCAEGFEWFVTSADTGGQVGGKKKVGCPIRIWMNDICDWSFLCIYGKVKRAAEDRKR